MQILREGDKRNEEEYQYNEGEDRRTQAASTEVVYMQQCCFRLSINDSFI